MKRFLVFLCVLGVMFSGLVWAEEAKTQVKRVAVLPFSVHSSEDITYVRDGIWDMLISRLSASEGIQVSVKQDVKDALKKLGGKDPAVADVYGLGKSMGIDYVVWGSITKIGNSISLDAKLLDVSTYKTPVGVFEQCQGMDDVIPRVTNFAKKIHYYVLGITPPAAEVTAPSPTGQGPSPATTRGPDEGKVIRASRGTFTSVINPSFITATNPLAQKGFWMSQRYKKTFKGMDIADVNGDGLNEVVVIDERSITVYQRNEAAFKLIGKIQGKKTDSYIAVDTADVNGNGIAEIIVTNMQGSDPNSFVVEFQEGKFVRIASDLRWFLRVINISGVPRLLGQDAGMETPFDSPIHEIVYRDGTYKKGKRMSIPKELSVYGLAVDRIDKTNARRVIALDEFGHICIYKETTESIKYDIEIIGGSSSFLWQSDDIFGGSNNFFRFGDILKTSDNVDAPERVYIKERVLTYDMDGNGTNEVVIVKNLSPASRIMKNIRIFTRSEIYNLEWDGLGMAENWRTKKIQGYVADYQIKDIDNDGKDEVVLAVGLGTSLTRSAIVAYDMKVQQAP